MCTACWRCVCVSSELCARFFDVMFELNVWKTANSVINVITIYIVNASHSWVFVCVCMCISCNCTEESLKSIYYTYLPRTVILCAFFHSLCMLCSVFCLLSVHSNPFIYHIYHVEFTLRLDVHKWRCKWISILRTHNTNGKSDCSSSCFVCRAHTAICQLHNDTLIYLYSIWYIEAMLMLACSCSNTTTYAHAHAHTEANTK